MFRIEWFHKNTKVFGHGSFLDIGQINGNEYANIYNTKYPNVIHKFCNFMNPLVINWNDELNQEFNLAELNPEINPELNPELNKELYQIRIHFKNTKNGYEDYGPYNLMKKEIAEEWIQKLNQSYPDLKHFYSICV